ncbi:MAG: hypothetical protein SNH94_06250 [Rikenellaceae bacterium]
MNIYSAVKELKNIDPNSMVAYEQALSIFFSIEVPIPVYTLQSNNILFRSRVNDCANMFESIDDIKNPDCKHVKSFARCNRSYQSVFYASEHRGASYCEFAENWNQQYNISNCFNITIGAWKLIKNMDVAIIVSPQCCDRESNIERCAGKCFDNYINSVDKETREQIIAFYNYVYLTFKAPVNANPLTYVITSAFSNYIALNKNIQGVCYPCVKSDEPSVNFAIFPEFVNNEWMMLYQVAVDEFTVAEIVDGKCNFVQTGSKKCECINIEQNKLYW